MQVWESCGPEHPSLKHTHQWWLLVWEAGLSGHTSVAAPPSRKMGRGDGTGPFILPPLAQHVQEQAATLHF